MSKFDLKKRDNLGPTSLTAEFAFLMANLSFASKNSLVFDPFAGTGGALVGCTYYEAKCFAHEMDWKMTHGGSKKKKKRLIS